MKKIAILTGVFFCWCHDIKSQAQFRKILDSANVIPPIYYKDESGKYYQRYSSSGLDYYVNFIKVESINNCDSFLIQGYIFLTDVLDFGLAGINIFLGKTKKENLYSIRNLGKSNNKDENPKYKDGFFSFTCKILKDDKLFFTEFDGSGLSEFLIGNLLSRKVMCNK